MEPKPVKVYRYFFVRNRLYGPYAIFFDDDPSNLPKIITKVHYERSYIPVGGFKSNLYNVEGKVFMSGRHATLWLSEPDDMEAARRFLRHYTELADKHRKSLEEAVHKMQSLMGYANGVDGPERPGLVKERRSDSYILHVP